MDDIIKTVIPKIKAEWEDIAYALRFKIREVEAIKEKHREDPKKVLQGGIEGLDKYKSWCKPKNMVSVTEQTQRN